ncbi:MAG TPA: hypothetical protein VFS43_01940 [Polyangiaceae bacterium]|nr:hypothetical protein [Polyangiaceae bacterium]
MRTDFTTLCARCVARFSPLDACPGCGSRALFDLGDPSLWDDARRAVMASRTGRGVALWSPWPVASLEPASLPTLSLCLAWSFGSLLPAALPPSLVFPACLAWVFGGLTTVGYALRSGRLRLNVAPTLALENPYPARDVDASNYVYVSGRVRASGGLTSPLGRRPCVAFRLTGFSDVGPLDDAALAPFELVDDEGRVYDVRGGAGTVVLPSGRPRPVRSPGDELAAFLGPRALFLDPNPPFWLAETVLEAGARVSVAARLDWAPVERAYRTPARRPVLGDAPDAPLIVAPAT